MIVTGVKMGSFASAGLLAADLTHFASIATAAVLIGGLVTLGILRNVAWAWREEKDAAVDKAERLAEAAATEHALRLEEAAKSTGEREAMRARLDVLEKQTNFADYQQQQSAEHKEIVVALQALAMQVQQTTTAIEFVAKQTFPTVIPETDGGTA